MIALRAMRPRRRGLTAVAVMVCLIVITMISGAALKVGLARRQELRTEEHQLQAEWLAEAGIQRGLAARRRSGLCRRDLGGPGP